MRVECPKCEATLRVTPPEDDSKVKCLKCGARFWLPEEDDDEEEEEDLPKTRRKGSRKQAAKKFPTFEVVGSVLAAVCVIAVVVFLVAGRSKPVPVSEKPDSDTASTGSESRPVDPKLGEPMRPALQQPVRSNPTPPNGSRTPPLTDPALARQTAVAAEPELPELFRQKISATLPPQMKAALLTPDNDSPPLEVPTFYSLRLNRPGAKPPVLSKTSRLSLDEIKQATTYIKVEAGDLSASGSGFLFGTRGVEGFVATNHHVIEAALSQREGGPKPKISIVFNSGVAGAEQELVAKVMAIDPIADLAILGVTGLIRAPKIIDPWSSPKLQETMEVRICGFPFGQQLAASGGSNPNISLNTGTISSLRLDKSGKLEQVQINGALNPGNSGGPIVDKDGRLVGIAVSTIKGSGLGFAVPVNDLIALLEGKLLLTALVPTGLDSGRAKFQVIIPVMDPLSQVKTVYVRYWIGEGSKPKGVKDPKIGWKPIERAEQLNLDVLDSQSSLSIATGELTVPVSTKEVVLQIASENSDGLVAASPPVSYAMTLKDIPVGSDARPFSELSSNPSQLAGQTLVIRGRILSPPASRGDVQELVITDESGKRHSKLRFLTSRELAVQFDEVVSEDQSKAVRVVCVVGQAEADGTVPVRVLRVDFLSNRGDRVVRSIPGEPSDDPIAALNRDPAKFAGQNIELKGLAVPTLVKPLPHDEFVVLFPHLARPRNLGFITAKGLAEKIADEKLTPNGIYKVRLSVKVGDVPAQGSGAILVTVRKIEILDTRGEKVIKTIE